jgi:hypothetical protein
MRSLNRNFSFPLRAFFTVVLLFFAKSALANQCDWGDADLNGRPLADKGPTEVSLRMYVLDITSIHDVDQSFVGDVFFRAEWSDPRLTHQGVEPCAADLTRVWTPVLQLLNRRQVDRIREPQMLVSPNGDVAFILRSYGDFSFRADLTDFPFDQQQLGFQVVSTYGEEDVRLVSNPEMVGMAERLSVANWTVNVSDIRSSTHYVPPVDKHLARLDIMMKAERRAGYYTWQQILPLFLVVMMTWVVFWIPHDYVPPRVGLAATAMLTLIAYRFAMSSVLPPIAYLTRLDVFIVGASILVYAGLATTVSVSYIYERDNEALANMINRTARWLSPLLLVIVAVYAFYW